MILQLMRFLMLVAFFFLSNQLRAEEAVKRRALLIGVTAYPNVGTEYQLQGGDNDVAVMARILRERFGFHDKEITILYEQHGLRDKSRLPTRANIEAAFARLAKGIHEGDQVVVFLAGHGAELPTPTGRAGHFLPRDVSPWKKVGEQGQVPNAIAGTEIGSWLRPIAEQRANLWVIVDACFSGRMVRGMGAIRQLPTEPDIKGGLQVPRLTKDVNTKRGLVATASPIPLPNFPGVACLYACQPDEVTFEERVIANDAKSPVMGLLTRALGEILLTASTELSYRELHGRIRKFYASSGRSSPNPIVEGAAINRNVLQGKVQPRKGFVVSETNDGQLTVNAGLLHGLASGSILAVYPPAGQGDVLRGYVHLTKVGPTTSDCRSFAERGGVPAKKALLIDGRAEVHRIEFGDSRLPVACVLADSDGCDVRLKQFIEIRQTLRKWAEEEYATFRIVDTLSEARLIIRFSRNEIQLFPTLIDREATKLEHRSWATHSVDRDYKKCLREQIEKCAKAYALLRLHIESTHDAKVQIATSLLKMDSERSDTGTPIAGAVKQVKVGDDVSFEIKNLGDSAIDVTILYLDSELNIVALFPIKNEDNRILRGATLPRQTIKVCNPIGLDYAVIIAVENQSKDRIEMTALAPARRSVATSAKQLDHPLGRLLKQTLEKSGKRRSASNEIIRSYTVDILPIYVKQ